MANSYITWNGPMPTTAAQAVVTTGTAIKTLLQIATPSTRGLQLVEWGISFDGSAAATPIKCELLTTGAVPATSLTAHVAAGVQPFNDSGAPASLVTLGTGATGYNTSGGAEGTITAVRMFDAQLVAPTNQYLKQWPLDEGPDVAVSQYLRVRVTAAAAVNALCYVVWKEA
jgi:hypothetical protein